MIVKLKNQAGTLSATFKSHRQFIRDHGYNNYSCNYDQFVSDNLIFKASNFNGFFKNLQAVSYTTRGVQENGLNFKSNYLREKTVLWQFTNVFERQLNAVVSPNSIVSALAEVKNETLIIEVTTNAGIYTGEYFVTENTDTEIPAFELKSAVGGDDAPRWLRKISYTRYLFGSDDDERPYIPKQLPEELLSNIQYPIVLQTFTARESNLFQIVVGGSKDTGRWTTYTLKNVTTGELLIYSNTEDDDFVMIDMENRTITAKNGEDRTITPGFEQGDFFNFQEGINTLEWSAGTTGDYTTDIEGLPLDFRMEADGYAYTSNIE